MQTLQEELDSVINDWLRSHNSMQILFHTWPTVKKEVSTISEAVECDNKSEKEHKVEEHAIDDLLEKAAKIRVSNCSVVEDDIETTELPDETVQSIQEIVSLVKTEKKKKLLLRREVAEKEKQAAKLAQEKKAAAMNKYKNMYLKLKAKDKLMHTEYSRSFGRNLKTANSSRKCNSSITRSSTSTSNPSRKIVSIISSSANDCIVKPKTSTKNVSSNEEKNIEPLASNNLQTVDSTSDAKIKHDIEVVKPKKNILNTNCEPEQDSSNQPLFSLESNGKSLKVSAKVSNLQKKLHRAIKEAEKLKQRPSESKTMFLDSLKSKHLTLRPTFLSNIKNSLKVLELQTYRAYLKQSNYSLDEGAVELVRMEQILCELDSIISELQKLEDSMPPCNETVNINKDLLLLKCSNSTVLCPELTVKSKFEITKLFTCIFERVKLEVNIMLLKLVLDLCDKFLVEDSTNFIHWYKVLYGLVTTQGKAYPVFLDNR